MITKDIIIRELVAVFPPAADIMQEYGLHCFSCEVGGVESVAEGCRIHQFDEETIDALVEDINEAIAANPPTSEEITVTKAAAEGIADIAKQEKKQSPVLAVSIDEQGGFCLEFQDQPSDGDKVFTADGMPEVKVCASPLNLLRLGGATIDVRDGRFKLDLPEERCCEKKEDCACRAKNSLDS